MLGRHVMCEYCDGKARSFYDEDGCDTVHIGFCPFCGRKLTVE